MQFDSVAEFLNMGGYGLYVWLSYGFTFFTLIFVMVISWRKSKQIRDEVLKTEDREKRIHQAKEADLL